MNTENISLSGYIARGALYPRAAGFTLIELLVVVSMMALLMSILLPSFAAARAQARATTCASNIRQVCLANMYYAQAQRDFFCPGAVDFVHNLNRWFGWRKVKGEPFSTSHGPLIPYLGSAKAIRQCPEFPVDQIASASSGFERGNGGYGYNNDYIGVRGIEQPPNVFTVIDDRAGARVNQIRRPAETIMFADAAFAASGLIEYSFLEPRFHPASPSARGVPSIHFRHRKRANVAWCDGHVDTHSMTYTQASAFYPAKPEWFDIGWFGQADDNSLFDLD